MVGYIEASGFFAGGGFAQMEWGDKKKTKKPGVSKC